MIFRQRCLLKYTAGGSILNIIASGGRKRRRSSQHSLKRNRRMAERFYIDPYQTRLETRVARHDDAGLVLEDTLCYPLGGGQPGDTATLSWGGGGCAISDTRRDRETRSIVHLVPPMRRGSPPARRSPWNSTGRAAIATCAFTPVCTYCPW